MLVKATKDFTHGHLRAVGGKTVLDVNDHEGAELVRLGLAVDAQKDKRSPFSSAPPSSPAGAARNAPSSPAVPAQNKRRSRRSQKAPTLV